MLITLAFLVHERFALLAKSDAEYLNKRLKIICSVFQNIVLLIVFWRMFLNDTNFKTTITLKYFKVLVVLKRLFLLV